MTNSTMACRSCGGSGSFEVQVCLAKFVERPCPDCQDLDEYGPDHHPPPARGWPGPWEGFDRNYPPGFSHYRRVVHEPPS